MLRLTEWRIAAATSSRLQTRFDVTANRTTMARPIPNPAARPERALRPSSLILERSTGVARSMTKLPLTTAALELAWASMAPFSVVYSSVRPARRASSAAIAGSVLVIELACRAELLIDLGDLIKDRRLALLQSVDDGVGLTLVDVGPVREILVSQRVRAASRVRARGRGGRDAQEVVTQGGAAVAGGKRPGRFAKTE